MKYNKLVRDFIPDIIKRNGKVPVTRVLRGAEFKKELKHKLVEEAHETADAKTRERDSLMNSRMCTRCCVPFMPLTVSRHSTSLKQQRRNAKPAVRLQKGFF